MSASCDEPLNIAKQLCDIAYAGIPVVCYY